MPVVNIGETYGRLTVVGAATPYMYRGKIKAKRWVCTCTCGTQRVVAQGNLRDGQVVSCGCARSDMLRARNDSNATHRHTTNRRMSAEYGTWHAMNRRCHTPSAGNYHKYGARGVIVCTEWRGRGGFELFLAHIGPKPEDADCIDRIDNEKGYEPGNVRWVTWVESNKNRRK